MTPRRPWWLLLVPGGLLLGHLLGSWPGAATGYGVDSGLGAASASSLLCVAAPLTVAAVWRGAVVGFRDRPVSSSFRLLVLSQLTVFVGVEVLEHSIALVRPAAILSVLIGAIAQVLAAALLTALVQGAVLVGRRARTTRRPVPLRPISRLAIPFRSWLRSTDVAGRVRPRGPPRTLSI